MAINLPDQSSSQDYIIVEEGDQFSILILNPDAYLPEDVPVCSVAFPANLSYMLVFDGTEWVQVGEEPPALPPDNGMGAS